MGGVLEATNVVRHFGAVRAADGWSITLEEGKVVGIVGPNGSGKTTFVNIVTGYVKPTSGSIRFQDREITGLDPRLLASIGLTRSFQIPQLYNRLTVIENMMIALSIRAKQQWNFWQPMKSAARIAEAQSILEQFGFSESGNQRVATLSEGGRKLLDVGLAFALQPSLLLLDEPTSGVSADDKFGVMDTLMGVIRNSGATTVFIEHDMDVVERYADRVLVFSEGKILADGTPVEIFANPEVRRHVLGEGI